MQALLPLLPWVHVALSILLVVAILLQRNEAALGSAFGGGDMGGPSFQKRGVEKTLFIATIIIATLFALSVLLPEIAGVAF